MATLSTAVPTLLDVAKSLDPDGKVADIAELLSQTNEILEDMNFIEGNLMTGHRSTVRTSLPTPTWRKLNEGVTPTKATNAQIDEQAALLEDWAEVDCKVAEMNGNTFAYRLSEAQAHIEGIGQEAADTIIYGNGGTNPEEFTGLANRYNDLSANNAQQIVDGGGTGSDNSSIWLVAWGPQTVHGIYPKGSKAGLVHEDLGKQVVQDNTGVGTGRLLVYQDRFCWELGLAVKDQRFVSRIANIDISDLTGISSAADISNLMAFAHYRLPNLTTGKPCFYMNRTTMQMLDILNKNDVTSGGGLTFDNVDGKRVTNFRGTPVKLVDKLTETEAQVT